MLILPCSASQIHISAFIWEDKAETRHYVTHPAELERSVFRISWQLKPSPGGSAAVVSLTVAHLLCLLWDASYPCGGICFLCSQRTVTPASASSMTTMVKINGGVLTHLRRDLLACWGHESVRSAPQGPRAVMEPGQRAVISSSLCLSCAFLISSPLGMGHLMQ